MTTFKQRKTAWITVEFRDRDGELAVPISARYRLDAKGTHPGEEDQEILAWTPLSPASSIEIQITPTQNDLVDDSHDEELHVLTTEATYGDSDILPDEHVFKVRNLKFYPHS